MNAFRPSLLFAAVLLLSGATWVLSRDSSRPPLVRASDEAAVGRLGVEPGNPVAARPAAINPPAAPSTAPLLHPPAANSSSVDDLFARLVPALLAADPAAAADTVERWSPGTGRVDALARFARLWAATDPDTALRWAAELPEEDRRVAGESLVTHFAAGDPGSALVAAEFFQVHQGDGRAERIMQSWTEQDAAAAIAWIRARSPGPGVDRLAIRIAWTLAQRDPAAAAEFASQLVSAGPAQEEAILAVVRHWAVRDPRAASAWVSTFPAGARREYSLALLRSIGPAIMHSGS